MNFGEIIKRERKKRGWQQEELAQKIGSNQATISRIENYIEPDFTTACLILDQLGLDIIDTWKQVKNEKEKSPVEVKK